MKHVEEAERIVDKVYQTLRDAILGGELTPGMPLSVPELSRRLNVSRSPVREAVLQLVSDRLAVERARKGCAVARIELADFIEIHDMRGALEALAVSLIPVVRPELIERLNQQIKCQEDAFANQDGSAYTAGDRKFHKCFHEACGNGRLRETLASLRGQMDLALIEITQSSALMECSIAEHKAIVACLAYVSPAEASEVMRKHIISTRDRIQERLRKKDRAIGEAK